MEFSYPLSTEWTTEEIIDVVAFFEGIELAYEKGVKREEIMARYRKFKEVVPSMAEEKTYFREFEKESGYASFPVIKEMKAKNDRDLIKLNKK